MSWAQLIKRVFDVDLKICPCCGKGEMKVVAAILKREVVTKILGHLGLPSEAPKPWPPRPPPQGIFLN